MATTINALMDTAQYLIRHAALLERLRAFFKTRSVLEVSTPLLREHSVTDPNIESLSTQVGHRHLWLQTSPEYAMKQLICEHPVDLYQICKAFRQDPNSRWHRTEFTLLEWYRMRWNMNQLMHEIAELISVAVETSVPVHYWTYQAAFDQFANCQPQYAAPLDLKACYFEQGGSPVTGVVDDDKALWEQLILTEIIEPKLPHEALTFITHYPQSLASLAKIDSTSQQALRFECYWRGLELANGYEEINDAETYRLRFEQDNQVRVSNGQQPMVLDQPFLERLTQQALPDCCGVALGIDRLLALSLDQKALPN